MSGSSSEVENVDSVRAELTVARNEIKNLRKQIASLQQVHRKDVAHILATLEHFRAANFEPHTSSKPATKTACESPAEAAEPIATSASSSSSSPATCSFQPIGIINTAFPEKRAVPRQPTVGAKLLGSVQLNDTCFTNPEHSLLGLQDFSHLWLIYHFHRNAASSKAKVAPPRLNGERVGVFSTRSPHRPCPIGLSLVEVQRIEGSRIWFHGTDMVDGTPVLDIKPYIPVYDNPTAAEMDAMGDSRQGMPKGRDARSLPQLSSREEPDGEESESPDGAVGGAVGGAVTGQHAPVMVAANGGAEVELVGMAAAAMERRPVVVRVPDWIMAAPTLEVRFNERAEAELVEFGVERASIVDVMSADPRSVYIRTKYGSQIFTFQLGEVAVTCKFDDPAASVTIVRIRRTENLPAQEE